MVFDLPFSQKMTEMIETNCRMSPNNVPGSQAIYLYQGNWAVATVEPDQMEISCNSHRHVKNHRTTLDLGKSTTCQ